MGRQGMGMTMTGWQQCPLQAEGEFAGHRVAQLFLAWQQHARAGQQDLPSCRAVNDTCSEPR